MYPQAIDLGLPSGTKWANCNLGAVTPISMGLVVRLKEERVLKEHGRPPKYTSEDLENNPMARGALENYIYEFFEPGPDIFSVSFFLDDDVVKDCWGDAWQLPTGEQTDELLRCCKRRYGSHNGWKRGNELTGLNGNRIFLPVKYNPSAYWWGKTGKNSVDKFVDVECYSINMKISSLPNRIVDGRPYTNSVLIRPVAKY